MHKAAMSARGVVRNFYFVAYELKLVEAYCYLLILLHANATVLILDTIVEYHDHGGQ